MSDLPPGAMGEPPPVAKGQTPPVKGELPPGLKDFGERLQRAAERDVALHGGELRPRRRRRSIGLPVVAALVAAAVSAGAVRVVDRAGDPIPADRGAGSGSGVAPQDAAVVRASAVEDPGGGPPWVVRAYTNAAGQACVQLGRLRDGVFGQVQAGTFRKLPASAPGTCAHASDSGPVLAVSRRAAVDLTIVFGLAIDRNPVAVQVGDRRHSVHPAGLGAFVTLFPGADPRARIVVRWRAGGRPAARVLR